MPENPLIRLSVLGGSRPSTEDAARRQILEVLLALHEEFPNAHFELRTGGGTGTMFGAILSATDFMERRPGTVVQMQTYPLYGSEPVDGYHRDVGRRPMLHHVRIATLAHGFRPSQTSTGLGDTQPPDLVVVLGGGVTTMVMASMAVGALAKTGSKGLTDAPKAIVALDAETPNDEYGPWTMPTLEMLTAAENQSLPVMVVATEALGEAVVDLLEPHFGDKTDSPDDSDA